MCDILHIPHHIQVTKSSIARRSGEDLSLPESKMASVRQSSGGNRGIRERIFVSTEEEEARAPEVLTSGQGMNGHYARTA